MTKLRAAITGVGAYVPDYILNNDELSKMVDTSDEWITERTGIKQRHIAAKGELTSDLAVKAGQQALRAGQIIRRLRDFVEKRDSKRAAEWTDATVTWSERHPFAVVEALGGSLKDV